MVDVPVLALGEPDLLLDPLVTRALRAGVDETVEDHREHDPLQVERQAVLLGEPLDDLVEAEPLPDCLDDTADAQLPRRQHPQPGLVDADLGRERLDDRGRDRRGRHGLRRRGAVLLGLPRQQLLQQLVQRAAHATDQLGLKVFLRPEPREHHRPRLLLLAVPSHAPHAVCQAHVRPRPIAVHPLPVTPNVHAPSQAVCGQIVRDSIQRVSDGRVAVMTAPARRSRRNQGPAVSNEGAGRVRLWMWMEIC